MSIKRTGAQIVAASLVRHGVQFIFSQSLPSAVLLAAEDLGIRQFVYRTENAGSYMADAFARLSGKVGVVTAQNGPAATLLVPGLAEAIKSSIPIVALVQEVTRPTTDRNAFQEFDHFGLYQACAKWVRRVTEIERLEDYVDLAFTVATGGRPGPAVLLLPPDLLLESTEKPPVRKANLGTFPLDRALADPQRITAATDLLAAAKRPLIVAGGGVHLSGAAAELAALQQEAQIPVMTTVMGKGAVDERLPLSMGVGGYNLGRLSPGRYLRPLIEQSDLIFFVGTRTAQNGTDSWSLFPSSAQYIHLDLDSTEVGRNYEAFRLVGDAKLTLAVLTERMRGRRKPWPEMERAIAEAFEKNASAIAPYLHSDASPIRPERLMTEVQKVLTPDTIVVADASYSTLWVSCYLKSLASGMRFITPRGLAGLGWGFPMAMGAKVARLTSPVICITGDGGFAHVWSELETSLRMKTPIAITVLNNGVLGYQKDAEDVKFGRHTNACYFAPVDHAEIARACGCRGVTIRQPGEYLAALREALAVDTTTVIDVITDPEAYPPVVSFDNRLEEVRRASGR